MRSFRFHTWPEFPLNRATPRSTSTFNQRRPPSAQSAAATKNGKFQPKCAAIIGVTCAVMAPPIWLPMFMTPETEPADAPAISELTEQNVHAAKHPLPCTSSPFITRHRQARANKRQLSRTYSRMIFWFVACQDKPNHARSQAHYSTHPKRPMPAMPQHDIGDQWRSDAGTATHTSKN